MCILIERYMFTVIRIHQMEHLTLDSEYHVYMYVEQMEIENGQCLHASQRSEKNNTSVRDRTREIFIKLEHCLLGQDNNFTEDSE